MCGGLERVLSPKSRSGRGHAEKLKLGKQKAQGTRDHRLLTTGLRTKGRRDYIERVKPEVGTQAVLVVGSPLLATKSFVVFAAFC